MTPSQAYSIASQWGSYMSGGDPGACFYSFPLNDGRPVSEGHREDCIAWARHCFGIAKGNDRAELRSLIIWFQTCRLGARPIPLGANCQETAAIAAARARKGGRPSVVIDHQLNAAFHYARARECMGIAESDT